MVSGQSLAALTARILLQLDSALLALRQRQKLKPHLLLVQGDTTSVASAALVAHYHRIAIGHVEAGLRTYDMFAPFPEELNRQLASSITSLHFAPTEMAAKRLLQEGFPASSVFVTGNTAIDSTKWQLSRLQLPSTCQSKLSSCEDAAVCFEALHDTQPSPKYCNISGKFAATAAMDSIATMRFFIEYEVVDLLQKVDKYTLLHRQQQLQHCLPDQARMHLEQTHDQNRLIPVVILLTCHRRENFGDPMQRIFQTIKTLVADFGPGGSKKNSGMELHVIFPVHPNPLVQKMAKQVFAGVPRIYLTPPMDFDHLAHVLQRSHFVLTDSGGLQEEATVWCKPVLVLREQTER